MAADKTAPLAWTIRVEAKKVKNDPMHPSFEQTVECHGQVLLLSIIVAALTSACLFVLYVPAVYTILTSLSVATLVLLRRSGGRMPEASR